MRLEPWVFLMETDDLIPAIEVDPNSVTPGVIGFVATFLVVAVVLLLIADMVRRVRRVRYRAEINERLDAEMLENETKKSEAD
jgi:membrane protein YdbS with pleckstrin-like domain